MEAAWSGSGDATECAAPCRRTPRTSHCRLSLSFDSMSKGPAIGFAPVDIAGGRSYIIGQINRFTALETDSRGSADAKTGKAFSGSCELNRIEERGHPWSVSSRTS
ncbi:hypothetical protein TRIP_B220042 [uncultured Desulfatiglans sp.]|nr:hypothetical protein TRIP_B220042 [uncultured Desulfatiglans sp.]